MFKGWFIFSASVWLLNIAADAADFQFSLNKKTLDLGERATLQLVLRPDPSESRYEPKLDDELFLQSQGFQVLERRAEKLGDHYEWHYEIATHSPGQVSLPPIQVQLGPSSFSTERLSFEAGTSRADGDDELRPEYQELKKPFPWWVVAKALGFLLAGLVLAIVGTLLLRRVPWRRVQNWRPRWTPRPENPRAWLRREIDRLYQRLAVEGDAPEIIDDATRTLRLFFSRQSQLPVAAWTTSELTKFLSQRRGLELVPFLKECDHWRFSGTQGTSVQQLVGQGLKQVEGIYL